MTATLPQYFLKSVERYGDGKTAVRQKELGIWQEYSWQESLDNVRAFGLGITALGLDHNQTVAAIGDNDRQYLWAYLGVMAVGGVMACLFTDAGPDEAAYIIRQSDAQFVLAQDQEQVDKMLAIREQIPQVKYVIYWDGKGLWNYNDPWLLAYDEVTALGERQHAQNPTEFNNTILSGSGDDIGLISYTSGTTGKPKGAMLSQTNLIQAILLFNKIDPRYDSDNHVSFLPMGWIAEHVIGIAPHCVNGLTINFPEEPETVRQDLREISPEGLVYNSRLWDNIVGGIQVRMLDATWLNRKLYNIFMPVGNKVADKKLHNETVGFLPNMAYKLGELLVFRPLRDQLGLINIRTAITGGAALSPDVVRFFHGIGVNLKQVYGSTEVATIGAAHRNGEIKFASVGQPVPGVDIRIADDGEILIASPTLFQGYYNNEAQTAEAITVDSDGKRWFHSSDAGYIDDDGHLIYLDRSKDMITLSNGERFSPQFIEGRLKFNPYIRDVMAMGDPSRDFVAAMVIIDFDNIARWAEKRNLGFTTFADLSQKEAVRVLVKKAVEEVNESLPAAGRLRAFVLMPKEFDADEAEMTRSRKLRRGVLITRYQDVVDALYSSHNKVIIQSNVTYQDGKTGVVENKIFVERLV